MVLLLPALKYLIVSGSLVTFIINKLTFAFGKADRSIELKLTFKSLAVKAMFAYFQAIKPPTPAKINIVVVLLLMLIIPGVYLIIAAVYQTL